MNSTFDELNDMKAGYGLAVEPADGAIYYMPNVEKRGDENSRQTRAKTTMRFEGGKS
jgi:hypothetical protein